VLFAEDFTAETVGNFPRRLTHKTGGAEVVEWQGRRWLSSSGQDAFVITLPEVLPKQFTMEFDLAGAGNGMELFFDGRSAPYAAGAADGGEALVFGTYYANLKGATRTGPPANTGRDTKNEVVRARVMADGEYVKVFVNERRVVNVPNAKLGRTRQILVAMNGWSAEAPRLIGDVRVAAGGRTLYDAIAETGRRGHAGRAVRHRPRRGAPRERADAQGDRGDAGRARRAQLTVEGHTTTRATRRPTGRCRRRGPRR
jgi:hypothetical protein